MAETLVGGDHLIAKYRAGQDNNPGGLALVQAAVDARRAGLNRPLKDPELRALYPLYLRRIRIDLEPTAARFTDGLEWACEPVASQVALLKRVDQSPGSLGWEVLDYVVAADSGQNDHAYRDIPDQLWDELLALASTADAANIGIAAALNSQPAAAIKAMQAAATDANPDQAAWAATRLGDLLVEQGDVVGAKAAFQLAIDSGQANPAAWAANGLGDLLAGQGDVVGAKAAYQLAIDSGQADAAATAANGLGDLLAKQGDVVGAKAAYQLAIDSGQANPAAWAANNLGDLLVEQGDVIGAKAAYQLAIDSGQADAVAMATAALDDLT